MLCPNLGDPELHSQGMKVDSLASLGIQQGICPSRFLAIDV